MNIVPWLIAIAVEIILLCVMQETVWLGLVILTVAFMLHGWFLHGNVQKRKKRKYIFMEAYCFLWGACMIGLYLADRNTRFITKNGSFLPRCKKDVSLFAGL